MDRSLEKHKRFTFEPFHNKALPDSNNLHIATGDYCLGGKAIQSSFGPKMHYDAAFKAHLDKVQEEGGIHLQQSVDASIDSLLDLEEKYPDHLRIFATPLRGLEPEDYFLDYSSIDEFLFKYAKFAVQNQTKEDPTEVAATIRGLSGSSFRRYEKEGDNGFYIGKNVMNVEAFKLAFEKMGVAFSHVNPTIEDKKRLASALQLGTQGFISVGALVKTLQDLPENGREKMMNATFKQSFERDLDRGIVMNVMTEVYFHLLSDQPLREETIQQLIGNVIARAELVLGHKVIMSDYQVLSDLLRLIGSNENQVRTGLKQYLEEGFGVSSRSPCHFKPFVAEAPARPRARTMTTERVIFEEKKRFKPIRNKGSYGSLIYLTPQGKKYGVFKSINAKFSMGKKVKSDVAYALNHASQEGYLPLPELRQVGAMISERATYVLDQILGTHSVPKTEIIYAQGEKGSFQHFLNGYKEAEEVQLPTEPNRKDLQKFQQFAILDFLLGNLDRKIDNWMVQLDSRGEHFKQIKMIDNANCFPRGHLLAPNRLSTATRSQYAWKTLDLAKMPLIKETKKLVSYFNEARIERAILAWKKDLGPEYFESFFGGSEGEVIKAFKDRVDVVRKFVAEDEARPIGDLGSYGSYEAIKEYLGETRAGPAPYVFPTV